MKLLVELEAARSTLARQSTTKMGLHRRGHSDRAKALVKRALAKVLDTASADLHKLERIQWRPSSSGGELMQA